MIRKNYCPKRSGHGIDACNECPFMGDDCDGDDDEL